MSWVETMMSPTLFYYLVGPNYKFWAKKFMCFSKEGSFRWNPYTCDKRVKSKDTFSTHLENYDNTYPLQNLMQVYQQFDTSVSSINSLLPKLLGIFWLNDIIAHMMHHCRIRSRPSNTRTRSDYYLFLFPSY